MTFEATTAHVAPLLPAPPCCCSGPWARPGRAPEAARRPWPTYNGDYSGKRYSPLTQINRRVKNLTLAWIDQADRRSRAAAAAAAAAGPLIVGGEGTGEYPVSTDGTIKARR